MMIKEVFKQTFIVIVNLFVFIATWFYVNFCIDLLQGDLTQTKEFIIFMIIATLAYYMIKYWMKGIYEINFDKEKANDR